MKLKTKFNTDFGNLYYCGDLHLGHSNILKINSSSRGHWSTVEEMNEWIESNVWSKLKPGDVLFDLGDTFWKQDDSNIMKIFDKIPKGVKLYKIIGNHDTYGLYYGEQAKLRDRYEVISDILDINVHHKGKDYMLSLCHYPLVSWNHKPYGSFMIHGHCHGNIDEFNSSSVDLRLDVGMDGDLCRRFGQPMIDFQKILDYFKEKIGGSEDFLKYVKTNSYNL